MTCLPHRTSITILCDAIDCNGNGGTHVIPPLCRTSYSGSGPTRLVYQSNGDVSTLLDRKYVHIEYTQLAMHCHGSLQKGSVSYFYPLLS